MTMPHLFIASDDMLFAEAMQGVLLHSAQVQVSCGEQLPDESDIDVVIVDGTCAITIEPSMPVVHVIHEGEHSSYACQVHKPVVLKELFSAIQALLHDSMEPGIVLCEGVMLDRAGRILHTANGETELTEKESDMLHMLHEHPHGVPKADLLAQVWGYGPAIETTTLESHLYRLRKKMLMAKAGCSVSLEDGLVRLEKG